MLKIRSVSSYAAVAVIAAAVSSAVTVGAVNFVGDAQAQANPQDYTKELMKQPLSDIAGREVRILEIVRPPKANPGPHQHPGHHTFGYVVEGSYEFGVNGGPTKLLKPGDTFYEPVGAVHSVSRNASPDKPVKLLVVMVADQKNPTTVPVN
jgi:quercetin dioxygenase-like cupin family protein